MYVVERYLVEEEHGHEDSSGDGDHGEVEGDADQDDDGGTGQPQGVVGEQPLDLPPKLCALGTGR